MVFFEEKVLHPESREIFHWGMVIKALEILISQLKAAAGCGKDNALAPKFHFNVEISGITLRMTKSILNQFLMGGR